MLRLNIPVEEMRMSGQVESNVPEDGKHLWNSSVVTHILYPLLSRPCHVSGADSLDWGGYRI